MLKFIPELELLMNTEQVKRILAIFFLIITILLFVGVSDYVFRGMTLYDSVVNAVNRMIGVSEGTIGLSKGFMSLLLTFVLVSVVYYLISYLIDVFLGISFTNMFMMSKIARLKNHYIICGAGRVGTHAAEKIQEMNKKFVVIEGRPDISDELKHRKGYLVINDDCTDEYVLKAAGITKAKGIVCALGDNQGNFYLILTAKHLNPGIRVAARANSVAISKKMKAVGADIIVTPEVVGGRKLAKGLVEI